MYGFCTFSNDFTYIFVVCSAQQCRLMPRPVFVSNCFCLRKLVLPSGIEPPTSPLPRELFEVYFRLASRAKACVGKTCVQVLYMYGFWAKRNPPKAGYSRAASSIAFQARLISGLVSSPFSCQ